MAMDSIPKYNDLLEEEDGTGSGISVSASEAKLLSSDSDSNDSMVQLYMDESASGIPKTTVQCVPSSEKLYYATLPSVRDQVDYVVPATGMCRGESDASFRKRKFESLSASYPGTALQKALNSMKESDSDSEDLYSRSLSALPTARDDDLTNLNWLQTNDLLKDIKAGEDSGTETDNQQSDASRPENPAASRRHPHNVPYDPQVHVNSKPNLSFSALIFMAIEHSPERKLPVRDIYKFIQSNFAYFRTAHPGWKNSVRHNLSLNKCFTKVPRDKGQTVGKGSLWCIHPEHRPNLIQTILKSSNQYNRSPFTLNQLLHQQLRPPALTPAVGNQPLLCQQRTPNSMPTHLFPFLSNRLAIFNGQNLAAMGQSSEATGAIDNVSMMGHLGGLTQMRVPIPRPSEVTPHPSDEHNYSSLELRPEHQESSDSGKSSPSSPSVDEGYAQESSETDENDADDDDDDDDDEDDGTLAKLADVPEDGTHQYVWDDEDDDDESSVENHGDEVDGSLLCTNPSEANAAHILMMMRGGGLFGHASTSDTTSEGAPESPKQEKSSKSGKDKSSKLSHSRAALAARLKSKTKSGQSKFTSSPKATHSAKTTHSAKATHSAKVAHSTKSGQSSKVGQSSKGGQSSKADTSPKAGQQKLKNGKGPKASPKPKALNKPLITPKEEPSSPPPVPAAPGSKGFNGPLILKGKRASTSPYAGNREKRARREW